MNKKFKLAIPFAVLALSCGIAAGCGGKHEHSYTEWGYNTTQHWKQCPEDDEIDESTKKTHNFVDGSCECGATQQTPPVTDVTVTNGTMDTNGTVTLSKTTAKTGESVTVTVAPKEGYQLKSLTVNGANVFGAMTGNTYEFTVSENTTVIAVFEKIASSSVNSVITGKKYGVTGNSLTAGTDVTLSAEGREDIVTEIKAEGDKLVIKVDEIAGDNWTVKVEGYVAATIIVPRDAAYTSAIALEYDLMENLSTSWGNYDGVDLSKQNDGKITHVGGGYYQWVSSKDSYESVAITANVVKGGYRQGVFIRFKGDTYADDGFVMVAKEENPNEKKISVCGAGDGYTGKNLWENNWDTYLNPITKDEYELTLVRDGANIYIFIDGEYTATKALPAGYADKECYVGLFCTDATKMENSERTFAIQDASEFLEISVTDETAAGAHGTVTIDKPTAKINEQVTVTLAPESGYKIKNLTIDGVSVLSQMTGTSYTFTALKDATVVAEFEENRTVDNVEVTVNAANGFTAEGTKITLEQLGEKQTGTVGANGKLTLGSAEKPVALGTHNVYADFGGYMIKLGTVNVEASDSNDGTAKPVSVTLGFTGSGIEYADSVSAANPATGELTYKLANADNGAYNNKYDIANIEGGGYFATKVKFTNDGSLSVILRRSSDNKEIKYVVQNNNAQGKGDGSNFVFGLDDDGIANGIWDSGAFVSLTAYNEAFKGDGVWIVLGYNATTGELTSYIGTSLNSVRPLKVMKNITPGLIINGMGAGNWFSSSTDTATVTFKYGATMADIGMAIEEKVTVTASVNDADMGTVALDATDGKYFSDTQVKVTVTANAGYVLKSIKVGDGEAVTDGWTTDGNVYTYKFTVSANTTVVAEFEKSKSVNSLELTVNAANGFTSEGVKITLEQLGEKQTGTVGANGKLTLGSAEKPIATGTHNVYADFGGYMIKLGTVNVEASDSNDGTAKPASVTLGFTGSSDGKIEYAEAVSSANPVTGELTFKLGNANNGAYNNKYDIVDVENGGYFATKIKFNDIGENKRSLSIILLVQKPDGTTKEIKYVIQNADRFFGEDGKFYMNLDDDSIGGGNGAFDKNNAVNIDKYGAALKGDGLWLVLGYNAETGGLVTYAGTELASVRPVKTWGTLPAGLKITDIGVGNWFGDSNQAYGGNNDTATVTFKYGATMQAIGMAIEEKVTVTASVNDADMGTVALDATDGKYFRDTQVKVTVTANAGYVLESIVIGEGEDAITVTADGENKWTQNGKVYTYNYLVTGDIKVVANFKEMTLADVTLTVAAKDADGTTEATLANGTQIKLVSTDGVNQYTYTEGGTENPSEMAIGEYKVTCYGYADATVTVSEAGGEIVINLVKVIAYATSDEITIDSANNTIAIKGNGASDRTSHRAISADLVLTEEQQTSENLTLTFTVKSTDFNPNAHGNDEWAANRFGVQIGTGEIGFFLFLRDTTSSDVVKLPGSLDINPTGPEQKWHDVDPALSWINAAAQSSSGLNFKVVRANGVIRIYAQNGEDWVRLDEGGTAGDLTIGSDVNNEIKLLACGNSYTFSDISVSTAVESEAE